MGDFEEIERRLGYTFNGESLRRQALAHGSHDSISDEDRAHQKRLSWLGDSVLDLVVADALFNGFAGATKGDLHEKRKHLTNTNTLARAASRLGRFPATGASVRQNASEGEHPRMRATAVETLIGAIYLEAGIGKAREAIARILDEEFQREVP